MSLLVLDGETRGVTGGEATIGVPRRPIFPRMDEGPDPIALKQLREEAEHLLTVERGLLDELLGQLGRLGQLERVIVEAEKSLAVAQTRLADVQARLNKLPPGQKEHVQLEQLRVQLENACAHWEMEISGRQAEAKHARHAIGAPELLNHARNVREGRIADAQRIIDAMEGFNVAQEIMTRTRGEAQKTTAAYNEFMRLGASVNGDRETAMALARHDMAIADSRLELAEAELKKAIYGLRFLDSGNAPAIDLQFSPGSPRSDDQAPNDQPIQQEPSPAPVAKSTESIVVRTTAEIAGPYRSSLQPPERGTHPILQRLLEQYPAALSTRAEEHINAFVHQLSDLDTHPPILEGLAKLALVVEQDSFPPTELLRLLGELHDSWRSDGIHADLAELALILLNRTKKQLDASYTLGFKALPIIPVVVFILYVTGASTLISSGVLSALSIAVATGAHVLQLINHRRKDLDEMRTDLKKLLPPLKREKLSPASSRQLPQETSDND